MIEAKPDADEVNSDISEAKCEVGSSPDIREARPV